MLIVDDVLLFPVRSLFWIFREIHNAAQQERADDTDAITEELSELYMMLETGRITEVEFDGREKVLLARLDKLQDHGTDLRDDAEGGEELEEDEEEAEIEEPAAVSDTNG